MADKKWSLPQRSGSFCHAELLLLLLFCTPLSASTKGRTRRLACTRAGSEHEGRNFARTELFPCTRSSPVRTLHGEGHGKRGSYGKRLQTLDPIAHLLISENRLL
jgi:hypothetical protein